jgi:hypothetical protein
MSKIFEEKEMDVLVADYINSVGLEKLAKLSDLTNKLKSKISDVEKKVEKKGKDAKDTVEVSQDVITKLKNESGAAQKLYTALVDKSRATGELSDKAIAEAVNADTEAKKKTEEANEGENGQ